MGNIQFIQVTPEQLQSSIIEGIKAQIYELKDNWQPKEPNKYLTRAQVAELLSIDISTVHNYTKRGLLKSYGIGRRVYYLRSEVEEAIVGLNK